MATDKKYNDQNSRPRRIKRTPEQELPETGGPRRGRISRQPSPQNNQNPQTDPRTSRKGNVGASMNINEQTPSRRRSAKAEKRIDPDAPEIKRGAKRAQEFKIDQRKKNKKRMSRLFMLYALLFILVFAVVSGFCALAFYANLVDTEPPRFETLKLKLCLEHEAEEEKALTVDMEKYLRDGVLYANMSAIAKEFDFVITGDKNTLRFITDLKTGESVEFELGTPFAEINGTKVRLEGTVERNDGSVFVPLSFFEGYVTGMTVELDEDKSLLYVLRNTSRNDAGRFTEEEVAFKLKEVKDSASISEFGLSNEIKDKTYFPTITPITPVPSE